TLARLEAYGDLLLRWSRAINLVSRARLPDLWRRHMFDSAQLLPLMPPPPPDRSRIVVDLGSGAGFPGLVLAILGAGEVHLVEADAKKAAFLREAARITGTEVALHMTRIEHLTPFPADVVTARALAPLPRLIGYAAPFLRPDGSASGIASGAVSGAGDPVALFPKGRDVERELTDSHEMWKISVDVLPSRSDPEGRIVRLRLVA
ncbi:MAG: 16S rRNA (guanine(527)-N(7))-methyltransferase RsmG, partial [Alphaproteobacteria bacterium]